MTPRDKLHLQMSGEPQTVLAWMKEIEPKIRRAQLRWKRLRVAAGVLIFAGVVPWLLLFGGLVVPPPLYFASLVLGPIGIWMISRSKRYELYPRYEMARELLSALRDDAERVVMVLDLTRSDDNKKIVRTSRSRRGKLKAYYRNPWLQLKLNLVDGNTLRFSLVDKVKTKAGSVARSSISITAKLSINPVLYMWSNTLPVGAFHGYEISYGLIDVGLSGYEADIQSLSVGRLLSRVQALFSYVEPRRVGTAAIREAYR